MLGRIRKNINMSTAAPFINLLFSLFLITSILCGAVAGVLTLISCPEQQGAVVNLDYHPTSSNVRKRPFLSWLCNF